VAVRPGNYVMLAISDTGAGMDADTKARIFEPFFTTKEAGRGTGLGLATVYGIVKQSGGYIWVYSEPGRGSTFKIYLPQTEEPLDEFLPESGAPTAARGTETVLLVEDDEALQKLTRECLEEAGYQVLAARDGPQALRVSRDYAGEIHLLLTDVVLPGISGPELAQQLRASRAGIRFLFVSGYADASLLQQGLLNPSANLVQKPFRPLELAQKVREILNGSPQT